MVVTLKVRHNQTSKNPQKVKRQGRLTPQGGHPLVSGASGDLL